VLLEFHHDVEPDQIEETNILMNRLIPLLLLDYRNGNNNSVLKILLRRFYHETNCNLRKISYKIKKKKIFPNLP
jgi:hypothetical protein